MFHANYKPIVKVASIILVALLLFGLATPVGHSERRKTTRKHLQLKPDQKSSAGSDAWYIPVNQEHPVQFYGYEKKQSSTKETLFIANRSDSSFSEIHFTIDYFDTSNRKIHSRSVKQNLQLSPGDTRRIDIRSWDTQRSYYYLGGAAPRKSATPYTVKVSIDSLLLRGSSTP